MGTLAKGSRKGERGSATVEFALVVPLLITMLMFSMFLTEIGRVKLKMQEASRYVAWEFTSYVLSDYGSHDHGGAWNEASTKVLEEAKTRYADLDSVEDNLGSGAIFDFEEMQVTVENQEVPFIQDDIPGLGSGGGIPGASQVIGAFNGGLASVLGFWGFNTQGQVQANVQMTVRNKYLARRYLDGGDGFFQVDQWGGVDLSKLTMSSRLTMVANAWNLADGADATTKTSVRSSGEHNNGASGENDHGMKMQVKQMAFMGLADVIQSIPGWSTIEGYLPINPLATYVVSHNYKKATRSTSQNCGLGNHMGPDNGETGLIHQRAGASNILDEGPQRCFDTAPFRDTHQYDQSLYRNIFRARGEWFMGCDNPQSDDPTRTAVYGTDEQTAKTICSTVNEP